MQPLEYLTHYNMEFKDYPQHLIDAKLQECLDYEAKYGTIPTLKQKTTYEKLREYRKNEWRFRQNVAEYAKYNAHKSFSK